MSIEQQYEADILIIDDTHDNLNLLSTLLREHDFLVRPAPSGKLALLAAKKAPPDLVLLDINMPEMNGFEVCERLKADNLTKDIPIIFISALGESYNKVQGFKLGAVDYITKPFQIEEILARINHQLKISRLQQELLEKNEHLAKEIFERKAAEEEIKKLNAELEQRVEQRQEEMLERLAIVGEKRDDDTGEHTFRVGNMSAEIAKLIGLGEEEVAMLKQAARLHDIGKVAVPDSILLKPGKLTKEEFDDMKRHTIVGAEMLAQSSTPTLRMAELIAHSHHERWDGKGYPQGIQGENIPLVARIVTVADVFDALTNERPYKHAWPIEEAIVEMQRCAGSQFDPKIIESFLEIIPRKLRQTFFIGK